MSRTTRSGGFAIALALAIAAQAAAGTFTIDGRTFTLPDGFTIEKVAGPPLVDRPIVADFDEQGRLYVADSSGSNDPVQKQLEERTHRVVRLEDADGDGRFDRSTVFADKMMFPEGALWFDGSLYVAAPPSLWKLTDTDDDGVADRREEWFEGKTLTGCANDLHGPYLGPDGWIYWCKGAFAEQTHTLPTGDTLVTRAAHIFRRKPTGGPIEPVMTGGMDNPVEVAFSPGGERFFTTTFLQHPGGGRRDGIIHAIYGGLYGKVHDVLDGHPRTGPDLMPVMTHLGPAAPAGLTRYESEVFGPEYRDNLFAALFNLHKVTRHVLKSDGASFVAEDSDLVSSEDLDFHPTDVLEDADGSLLVVDTGGWYKLCCPTSQLGKPDVLGAIYRVRREGAKPVDDPRGLGPVASASTPDRMARQLDDPRPAVRRRAIAALAAQDARALPALGRTLGGASAEARRNAVWAATRIARAGARRLVRGALDDEDASVRQAAAHSASVWRDRGAVPQLRKLLADGTPANRRVAAEALGRTGDAAVVPDLLRAAGSVDDRVLEHSIVYAIIEINAPDATRAGLGADDARTRRAALIALDQMKNGGLNPEVVAPLLASEQSELQEAASWIATRHPEWGGALAGWLKGRLARWDDLGESDRDELMRQLARFAGTPEIADLLAARLEAGETPRDGRREVLEALARAEVEDVPRVWIEGIEGVLAGDDEELVRAAIVAVRALPIQPEAAGDLVATLRDLGKNDRGATEVRLEALAAVPGGPGALDDDTFAFLLARLDAAEAVATRTGAADVLARAELTTGQLLELAGALATAGPLELRRLLPAFERSDEEAVGLAVVANLNRSPALAGMRAELLRPVLDRYGPGVQHEAAALYSAIQVDATKQAARLEELLKSLGSGDVRRGQEVFNGRKAACATCHAIGYLGGRVGPDLTRIGQVRAERDLLEAVVYPSASFVRSYEPVVVATTDGRVVSGVLKKDAADEVVLAVNADEEAHIPREEIEAMRPGTVSVMPEGLDAQLTPQELADLVAFLKACR